MTTGKSLSKTPQNNNTLRFAIQEVWSLAWPTIITMTSFTIMQFVDKLMISRVGPTEVTAQGNAGIWSFAVIATIMGVVTVVNTFVSQHLGAGTPKNGPRYPWAACWLATISWCIIIVPFIFIVPYIFQFIHPDLFPKILDRVSILEHPPPNGRVLIIDDLGATSSAESRRLTSNTLKQLSVAGWDLFVDTGVEAKVRVHLSQNQLYVSTLYQEDLAGILVLQDEIKQTIPGDLDGDGITTPKEWWEWVSQKDDNVEFKLILQSRLVVLETQYATYTLIGSLFLLIGRGFVQFFFGMHMPKVITVSTIIANIVNVIANYILIFGEEGIPGMFQGIPGTPALGLQGAAIATMIGMFMEMIIPLAIFLGPKFNNLYGTRAAWRPNVETMKSILRLGWPGSIQWGNEIVCWALFMTVFVGKYGTNAMAAGWIALGYLHLSFMPAIGINVAVNSIVGKYIGAKTPDIAASRARVGVGIALVYMTLCAIIFVVFRTELMEWFVNGLSYTAKEQEEIIRLGANMLILVAIFQTVDALGIVYTGALRGAGDTVWPGVVTAIFSWVFIVGGGWVAVTYFPETGSIGPWIAAASYVIIIGITMTIRFERGGWRSIDLLGNKERLEAGRAAPLTIGPPSPEADSAIADFVDPPTTDQ